MATSRPLIPVIKALADDVATVDGQFSAISNAASHTVKSADIAGDEIDARPTMSNMATSMSEI